ncbi:MAG: DUF5615 family PIN-like protein [Bacteroidota bacterium]
MLFSELSFIADENIDQEVVKYLRSQDVDVDYIPELGLSGLSDRQILSVAYNKGKSIITHDSDFGDLIFIENKPFHAVVYLRPGHFDPSLTIDSLKQLLDKEIEVNLPAIIVATRKSNKLNIRIREL